MAVPCSAIASMALPPATGLSNNAHRCEGSIQSQLVPQRLATPILQTDRALVVNVEAPPYGRYSR